MVKDIQNKSIITFKLNKEFGDWIELANACGEETSVDIIKEVAKIYLNYYLPADEDKRADLISILKPMIGGTLTEYCLKNSDFPIGLCLQEVIEVRGVLSFCASRNKLVGDLSPKDIDITDFINNPRTLSPERFTAEGTQNTNAPNHFEYSTELNARIQLEENSFYLKPVISKFIMLLVKEEIDARKIRFCKKCGRIFWLKRGTQIACSKKCINAINSANWRKDKNK